MRVCLVTRTLPSAGPSVAASYAEHAARSLAARGHEVTLLVRDPGAGVPFDGVRIRIVRDEWDRFPEPERVVPFRAMFHAMGVYRTLVSMHAEAPLDYVELVDRDGEGCLALRARRTLGALSGVVCGVRLLGTTMAARIADRSAWFTRADAALAHQEEECLRTADFLLSHRADSASLPGFAPIRIAPVPFVAPSLASPGRRVPVVTFLDPLSLRRGALLFSRAMTPLLASEPALAVRIAGEDTHTAPVARSVAEYLWAQIPPSLRPQVALSGPLVPPALGRLLDEATLSCFPALDQELSYRCLEAMARGCAVVAGPGGAGGLVEDGVSGILSSDGTVGALTEALRRAHLDGGLRARVTAGARARVERLCDPARYAIAVEESVESARRDRRVPARRSMARGEPAVSVVVPFYNLTRYLPGTLASLDRQTMRSFETIVIDDGSTEPGSAALLARVEATGVRVLRQANYGLSAARNAGIAAARGRFVLPLDADDLLEPSFLEKCLGALEADETLAYVTTFVSYFDDDPARPTGVYLPWGLDRDTLPAMNVAGTCAALMSRERVLEAGGYDESLTSYEDWDLYCTFAERGFPGAVLPELLFLYRWRADSMTRTEVATKKHHLIAALLAKHPQLSRNPDRTLRLMLAESVAAREELLAAEAARRASDEEAVLELRARLEASERWNVRRILGRGPLVQRLESSDAMRSLARRARQLIDGA